MCNLQRKKVKGTLNMLKSYYFEICLFAILKKVNNYFKISFPILFIWGDLVFIPLLHFTILYCICIMSTLHLIINVDIK